MAEMTQRLITLTLNQSHDFLEIFLFASGCLADADALQSADCDRLTTKTSFKSLSLEAGEGCVFSHWGGCLKFYVKSVRGLPDVILQVLGFNMYKYFAAAG
jgi:hypothetical protein